MLGNVGDVGNARGEHKFSLSLFPLFHLDFLSLARAYQHHQREQSENASLAFSLTRFGVRPDPLGRM